MKTGCGAWRAIRFSAKRIETQQARVLETLTRAKQHLGLLFPPTLGGTHLKILTIFAILFFITLIGLIFYAHYDTKKFIESLPQPPATQHEVAQGEKTPTPHEKRTAENEAEPSGEDTAPVQDTHGAFHEPTDAQGHVHDDSEPADSTALRDALETDVPLSAEETRENTTSAVQLPPGVVPWRTVSPDGEIVYDSAALIAAFGDTPKVHAYLALARKIHTADSYTRREIYEFTVLEKAFTQDPNILPSHLERLRQRAVEDPDGVLPSWRALKNNPNVRIIEK